MYKKTGRTAAAAESGDPIMKKIVSVLLVLCMLPMLLTPAFAAKHCDCGHSPVIYVPGFGKSLFDDSEETSERIYPPTTEAFKESAATIVLAVLALVAHRNRLFADLAMKASNDLLGKIGCDKNGNPQPGTGVHPGALPTKDVHGTMCNDIADYSFVYDWRLSPLDIAEQLHTYIRHILALTGHDQVILVCHSMGGTVFASYLSMYGSAEIERMICLTPAWKGLSIMGSLLSGEAQIGDKSEELSLFLQSLPMVKDERLQLLIRAAEPLGVYKWLLRFLQKPLDQEFERVYYTCLRDMFASMPGIWAFVPDSYYNRAKAFTFAKDAEEYAALIQKIDDYHYNVQNRLEDLLRNATASGMQLVVASGYGISTVPLSVAHTAQSDFLIDTVYTSIGAVSMPFGSRLPEAYTQAVRDGHDHLSPDGLIDASTCAYPEYTWFIHGMMHFDYPYKAVPFVRWAVAQTKQPTVSDDAQWPQFLLWDDNAGFSAVTAE